ncbi:histidine kinase dimerization/phospho-acceptor domain-containing protein [Inquilinus limosus]|uniref:sensor histidine kinase n=1 Tax=Inquilinus limosus TaxID=171674 RepID=UPI003F5CD9BB
MIESSQKPKSRAARILQRLRARPDSEHEMRFNGVALSTATLIYLVATKQLGFDEFVLYAAYIGSCLLVFVHILLRPQICITRRIIAMIGDFGVLFCEMYIRGETAAFLFPLFIWIILGNGFRFGIPFLVVATIGGLISFGAVVATTPFWSEQNALSAGLLGGMLLVSLCATPLIRRLSKDKRQAEAANQAKSFFLASVSHELRTPLTAIVGTGSVLQDTKLDPAQREMTRRVVSAGERLMTLLNDISAVSRSDRADAPPAVEAENHSPQNRSQNNQSSGG